MKDTTWDEMCDESWIHLFHEMLRIEQLKKGKEIVFDCMQIMVERNITIWIQKFLLDGESVGRDKGRQGEKTFKRWTSWERRSEDLKKWLVVSNRAAIESKDHNLIIQV